MKFYMIFIFVQHRKTCRFKNFKVKKKSIPLKQFRTLIWLIILVLKRFIKYLIMFSFFLWAYLTFLILTQVLNLFPLNIFFLVF